MALFVLVRDDVSKNDDIYSIACTRKKLSHDASNVCDGIGESDDDIVVVFVFVEGRSSDDALRKEASFFPSSGRNATTTDDHRKRSDGRVA